MPDRNPSSMGHTPLVRAGWRPLMTRLARIVRRPLPADHLLKAAFAKLEAYRVRAGARASMDLCVRASAPSMAGDPRRDVREAERMRPLPDMLRLGEGVPLRDEIAEAQRRLDHLRAGLARLPHRTGDAFRLHRIEGMSYRQIALVLNVPVRTVERHVAAAALFLADWSESL